MAMGWWLDTGIYFKMKRDVEAVVGAQRVAWERPSIRVDQPLGLTHVLPSMILFATGILLSVIAFAVEIVHNSFQRRKQEKEQGRWATRSRIRRGMSTIAPKVELPLVNV